MVEVLIWDSGRASWKEVLNFVVGHVALRSEHGYYSFWPRRSGIGFSKGIVYARPADFSVSSYDADVSSNRMGRYPDVIVRIAELDERAIDEEWTRLRTSVPRYQLFKTNCVSVSNHLLHVGFVNTSKGRKALGNTSQHSFLHHFVNTSNDIRWAGMVPSLTLFYALLIKNAVYGYGIPEKQLQKSSEKLLSRSLLEAIGPRRTKTPKVV